MGLLVNLIQEALPQEEKEKDLLIKVRLIIESSKRVEMISQDSKLQRNHKTIKIYQILKLLLKNLKDHLKVQIDRLLQIILLFTKIKKKIDLIEIMNTIINQPKDLQQRSSLTKYSIKKYTITFNQLKRNLHQINLAGKKLCQNFLMMKTNFKVLRKLYTIKATHIVNFKSII